MQCHDDAETDSLAVWFEFDDDVLIVDVWAITELMTRVFVEANRTESVEFDHGWLRVGTPMVEHERIVLTMS